MAQQAADMVECTLAEAEILSMDIMRAGLVPYLVSSPGLGKSALAKQLAIQNQLKLVDIRLSQCDPADLQGFPMILPETASGVVKAGYVPMDIFPVEGDPLPPNMAGWLILADELGSTGLAVQAAAYKVILDKMIGMHNMHENVLMMAAGNKRSDNAIVNKMGTAMQSRIITLIIRVCHEAFHRWADHNSLDHRVKAFLKFKPKLLHDFDPSHSDVTFPCPRTWEFVSKIITPMKDPGYEKLPILAGTVGQGAGREFLTYLKVYTKIPTVPQILGDPERIAFGDETSMHCALASMVAQAMDASNAATLAKFINRLEVDFQAVAYKAAIARDYKIRKVPCIREWVTRNAAQLNGY